jgi:hypothetical protein
MMLRDQRHGIECTRQVRAATAAEDAALFTAALLHDCGKGRVWLWQRSRTMLGVLAPSLRASIASEQGAGWRQAFWRLLHHPEIGAAGRTQAQCRRSAYDQGAGDAAAGRTAGAAAGGGRGVTPDSSTVRPRTSAQGGEIMERIAIIGLGLIGGCWGWRSSAPTRDMQVAGTARTARRCRRRRSSARSTSTRARRPTRCGRAPGDRGVADHDHAPHLREIAPALMPGAVVTDVCSTKGVVAGRRSCCRRTRLRRRPPDAGKARRHRRGRC